MDMPRLFPIGEVANLFNLSVSSLRDPGDDILSLRPVARRGHRVV